MGFLDRLRESLTRTKQQLVERFEDVVKRADAPERRSRPLDVDTVDALEEILIAADVGVAAAERIIASVKSRARGGDSLRDVVKQEIRAIFEQAEAAGASANGGGQPPRVVLIVGVNGTGK